MYGVHGFAGIVDEVNVNYDISASTLGHCGKLSLRSRRAASWHTMKSTGDMSPSDVAMMTGNRGYVHRFNIGSNVVSANSDDSQYRFTEEIFKNCY